MAGAIMFLLWMMLLSCSSLCLCSELDVKCLKIVLQSVVDPNGTLKSSWNFSNSNSSSICQFLGVECWEPDGNNIYSLHLSNLGLEGQFPQGLEYCTTMISLNLSSNKFSGVIPSDISDRLPNVLALDLSYNDFFGEIPVDVSKLCLNSIKLQHNQLSGQIPQDLQNYSSSSFVDNQGLCGAPLGDCPAKGKWRLVRVKLHRINDESSIATAVGFVVGFVVAFYFPHWFIFSERLRPYIFPVC